MFLLSVSIVFLACTAYSHVSGQRCPSNSSGEPQALWQITAPHLKNPSYLFGTIHYSYKNVWKAMPNYVDEAFDNSTIVVLEVDPTDIFGNMISLMRSAALPKGQTLKNILDPSVYSKLHEYVEKRLSGKSMVELLNGADAILVNIDHFKPIWAYMFIAMSLKPDQDPNVVDIVLGQKAKREGKRVRGIVSLDEHYKSVDLDDFSSAVLLNETLSGDMKRHAESFLEIFRKYVCGEAILPSLMFETDKSKREDPKLVEAHARIVQNFIYNRNQLWVPEIDAILRTNDGPVFFAFGIAHLNGENSVVDLLQKQGYTVTPMGPKN